MLASECYISVDVETAGPNPADYSLLSIGACLVSDLARGFYIELQPLYDRITVEAFSIHQLSLDDLRARGAPPRAAMQQFETWIAANAPANALPVFVAFNAPFDWMFVNDYFHRYLGYNPFGHSALDIKALYMGATRGAWLDTGMRKIMTRYQIEPTPLTHNALSDARDQARLFQKILTEIHGSANYTNPRE